MNLLLTLISTQKGWIVRQLLKGTAYAGTIATTWLVAHGVAIDNPQAVSAALGTVAVGLAEFVLSRLASGVAAK